jgi:hypothetical protein
MNTLSRKFIFNYLLSVILFFLCPVTVLSQSEIKEVCFNFYIVTKKTSYYTESSTFAKQKKILLNQLLRTQAVFDKNLKQECPAFIFSNRIIRQITWAEARRLSYPIDQGNNEFSEDYLLRKLDETLNKTELIVKKINEQPEMKYRSFLELRPGRVIAKAENALQSMLTHYETLKIDEYKNSKDLELNIINAVDAIKKKLEFYAQESVAEITEKASRRINQYEQIDQSSARSWAEGELTVWNDLEAQDTSVELKNLLHHYRTTTNQCLDIYVVPSAKTPSRNNNEVNVNGKWTKRGGAAISSKNFPRTTAGRGHAILLTYNAKIVENRLAHEFGHLLLEKGDAHAGKVEKDLMHENSKGGSYLNGVECSEISENVLEFFGGTEDRKQMLE